MGVGNARKPIGSLKDSRDYKFEHDFITGCDYDDYDKLIIMCDSLAVTFGFCILEKRFIDVARRYGIWDTSVRRWNATFKIKEYFEDKIGCSIYDVLPGIKETTFIDLQIWGRQ